MAENTKFCVKELSKDEYKWLSNCIKAVKTWEVVHTDYGGYTRAEVTFHVLENGEIYICGENEGFGLTLIKEQLEIFNSLYSDMKKFK